MFHYFTSEGRTILRANIKKLIRRANRNSTLILTLVAKNNISRYVFWLSLSGALITFYSKSIKGHISGNLN